MNEWMPVETMKTPRIESDEMWVKVVCVRTGNGRVFASERVLGEFEYDSLIWLATEWRTPSLPSDVSISSIEQESSCVEDEKPFKAAWDAAGEEAKRLTLTPNDRIDVMVEALDKQFQEIETKLELRHVSHTEDVVILSDRLDTQAQSLEKLMDIVSVLIKKYTALEDRLDIRDNVRV